jgi:Flp pilus assembly protein TadD
MLAHIFLCLLAALNGNAALATQKVPLTEERRVPGAPVTDESVEVGLRKNREVLRKTPQFQTDDAPTHLRLAEILSQQGDPNGAIEEYEAVIALNPRMVEAYRGLGAVYIDKHEWEKAEQALRMSTELDAQDNLAFYWLGRSLMAQDHFRQAHEAFETATDLAPTDAEAYSDLGLVLMAQGYNKEAEHALRQAINLQPDLAEAHHRLERVRATQDSSQQLIQSARKILHTLFRRE